VRVETRVSSSLTAGSYAALAGSVSFFSTATAAGRAAGGLGGTSAWRESHVHGTHDISAPHAHPTSCPPVPTALTPLAGSHRLRKESSSERANREPPRRERETSYVCRTATSAAARLRCSLRRGIEAPSEGLHAPTDGGAGGHRGERSGIDRGEASAAQPGRRTRHRLHRWCVACGCVGGEGGRDAERFCLAVTTPSLCLLPHSHDDVDGHRASPIYI
jgi:hypothetical protein